MDHLSGRMQRLWEAIGACRIGSDDLSDPEFADLAAQLAEDPELFVKFQRLQRADGAIKATFVNVPIPAGLAERVSLRLAEARPSTEEVPAAAPVQSQVVSVSDTPVPLRNRMERFSQRRLLIGFTALAAAAGLLAAVWIETQPRHETPASVLDEAMNFFGKDNQSSGELVSRVVPPAEFPLSPDIAQLRDVRWRHIDKFLGSPAVAYDLPTIGGRATLYVIGRTVADLPGCPPANPVLSTGGKSAAAWQTGDTLYVLVVEGDAGTYSSYLDQSHGPLT